MASPAEITKALPETLPADFNEWDGGDPPTTLPVNTNGAEDAPGPGDGAQARTQPARLKIVPHSAENLNEAPPFASPAARDDEEVPLRTLRSKRPTDEDLIGSPSSNSESFYETEKALFQSFRSNSADLDDMERASRKKKTVVIASAVAVVLLLGLIPLIHPSVLSMFANAKSPAASQMAAMNALSTASAPKPSPSTPMTTGTPTATDAPTVADTPAAMDAEPTTATEEKAAPQVDSNMMRNQLNAPTRISHDIKTVAGNEPPPSSGIGGSGMEGLSGGGAVGNLFKGQAGPRVAPKTVNISAGVAFGLLIQKTAPVYPAIARVSHTSGTVVLQATISKTGMIEHLRVVSGPVMLQQAAVDAVKTWRYNPYLLDHEPVEVETTVNVVFSQGN